DRLRFFEFLEHLLLAPRIIAVKITIDKGRVHSGWRDAIAADVVGQVVLSYRIGHGHNRTLAHRIGEAIGEARGSGDRCHVQDDTATVRHHLRDRGTHTVVHPLYVD